MEDLLKLVLIKFVVKSMASGELSNSLIEHEFDHIFIGHVDTLTITPNPNEVSDHKWLKLDDLRKNLQTVPQEYTEWFKIILANRVFESVV